MDRQRIEFDKDGIKVYTNNGLIDNNGKTTHTTIDGDFYMSADNLVRLLAHLSDSTFVARKYRYTSQIGDWMFLSSIEDVEAKIEEAIAEATRSVRHTEKEDNIFKKEIERLRKLIEDHNRGCVGLFHKKIKL